MFSAEGGRIRSRRNPAKGFRETGSRERNAGKPSGEETGNATTAAAATACQRRRWPGTLVMKPFFLRHRRGGKIS